MSVCHVCVFVSQGATSICNGSLLRTSQDATLQSVLDDALASSISQAAAAVDLWENSPVEVTTSTSVEGPWHEAALSDPVQKHVDFGRKYVTFHLQGDSARTGASLRRATANPRALVCAEGASSLLGRQSAGSIQIIQHSGGGGFGGCSWQDLSDIRDLRQFVDAGLARRFTAAQIDRLVELVVEKVEGYSVRNPAAILRRHASTQHLDATREPLHTLLNFYIQRLGGAASAREFHALISSIGDDALTMATRPYFRRGTASRP